MTFPFKCLSSFEISLNCIDFWLDLYSGGFISSVFDLVVLRSKYFCWEALVLNVCITLLVGSEYFFFNFVNFVTRFDTYFLFSHKNSSVESVDDLFDGLFSIVHSNYFWYLLVKILTIFRETTFKHLWLTAKTSIFIPNYWFWGFERNFKIWDRSGKQVLCLRSMLRVENAARWLV